MPDGLTLLRPALALLAFLAVPLALLFVATFVARRRALARFAGRGAALVSRSVARQAVRAGLALSAVVALALAAAGPFVDLREIEIRWSGADVVVALDVSQSMAVQDAMPDRLHAAQDAIRTLVDGVPGARVALVLFGGSGIVRYPATTDPRILAEALDAPGRTFRPSSGSSLKAALDAALGAFPEGSTLPKAVVVVSDGEDLSGERADMDRYRATGVRLYGLMIGTADGAQVPTYDSTGKALGPLVDGKGVPVTSRMRDEPLASYAAAAGGRTWRYGGTPASVAPLAATLRGMGSGSLAGGTQRRPDDRYQLLAAIALAALLLEWIVSERRLMPRPRSARVHRRGALATTLLTLLVAVSCASSASTNETANGLFAAGDHQGALERYRALLREHPELAEVSVNAGNALFAQRDFDHAVSNYDAALTSRDARIRAIAFYDKGDALFRLGKFDEARAAFADALRLDPNDRDAKFNLEVIDRVRQAPQGRQPGQPGDQGGDQSQPGGATASPGASGAPSGGGDVQSGRQQPGGSDQQGRGGSGATDSLADALRQFRADLTPDEALRLLEALERERLGIDTYLVGPPSRRGQDPQY